MPVKSYKGMAITSWILIFLTCLIAVVPVIGFGTWLAALVVVPLTLIFAIVILTRGGKAQGILLILASVIFMPAFLLIAPFVSTILLGASINAQEQAQEKQIIGNLDRIDTAKKTWASETSAAAGTAVTMTELTKYLGGQEIKPVVGESYNPHPVGEAPVAKLPATKSLASHKAGEEITATASSPISAASPVSESPSPSPSASAEEEE
jgi:cytoskeletal protein RodZ